MCRTTDVADPSEAKCNDKINEIRFIFNKQTWCQFHVRIETVEMANIDLKIRFRQIFTLKQWQDDDCSNLNDLNWLSNENILTYVHETHFVWMVIAWNTLVRKCSIHIDCVCMLTKSFRSD